MRISDWSSDVCSSDLLKMTRQHAGHGHFQVCLPVDLRQQIAFGAAMFFGVFGKLFVGQVVHLRFILLKFKILLRRESKGAQIARSQYFIGYILNISRATLVDLRSEERLVGKESFSKCR